MAYATGAVCRQARVHHADSVTTVAYRRGHDPALRIQVAMAGGLAEAMFTNSIAGDGEDRNFVRRVARQHNISDSDLVLLAFSDLAAAGTIPATNPPTSGRPASASLP